MSRPNFFSLYDEGKTPSWQIIRDELPPAQGAKLLYALAFLFFEGEEAEGFSLPREAKTIYQAMKPSVAQYRARVLNGMKANDERTARESAEN